MSLEEIPECVYVIRNAFKTVADEFGFTEENAPRFTAFATDEGRLWYHFCKEKRPMYVYMIGDRIVGYYSIALLNENEAEINNLAVLPEYRHRNIGRSLFEDSIAKVKVTGRTKIKISIVEENKRLRDWYESFGFVHTGSEKFDFFPFTCGYMEKELV
ncbi:MAG: GNAT family N-acetyltransferase [Clostridia bacterium]|nr:GNAT family N-acetyltransferase [Clostridia bacterium]